MLRVPCAAAFIRAKARHAQIVSGEIEMTQVPPRIGWIGAGRMGFPMAKRLLEAGHDVAVWNRTAEKAEPLRKLGARIVGRAADLATADVIFSIVSTGKDLEEVYFGPNGAASVAGEVPSVFVDCSTIGVEESARVRSRLRALGAEYIAAPVSGNAKVIVAGKLSAVASGPETVFHKVERLINVFAPNGVSYVGEGELARVCKIAHNVMLGVVIENLIEITLLANRMGVSRRSCCARTSISASNSAASSACRCRLLLPRGRCCRAISKRRNRSRIRRNISRVTSPP
jgi:3-hydroxyisobutyrate dehydrogenase